VNSSQNCKEAWAALGKVYLALQKPRKADQAIAKAMKIFNEESAEDSEIEEGSWSEASIRTGRSYYHPEIKIGPEPFSSPKLVGLDETKTNSGRNAS
jgi:hypothetical protein